MKYLILSTLLSMLFAKVIKTFLSEEKSQTKESVYDQIMRKIDADESLAKDGLKKLYTKEFEIKEAIRNEFDKKFPEFCKKIDLDLGIPEHESNPSSKEPVNCPFSPYNDLDKVPNNVTEKTEKALQRAYDNILKDGIPTCIPIKSVPKTLPIEEVEAYVEQKLKDIQENWNDEIENIPTVDVVSLSVDEFLEAVRLGYLSKEDGDARYITYKDNFDVGMGISAFDVYGDVVPVPNGTGKVEWISRDYGI